MTRTFTTTIAASLAFICTCNYRLRPRPAREGDAGRRRHGRLGERNPARVQRGRRAEILEGFGDRPGGRRASRRGENRAGNEAVLIAPISKPLSAGAYKVHWQAVSVDTHHTQGTFEFTVKP